jgi:type I restriction enzyme S subunit
MEQLLKQSNTLNPATELKLSMLKGINQSLPKGWEIKKLGDISSRLGDGLHGTPKYTTDGDYYFINGNNLTEGVIEFKESTKRVSIDEYKKYKKNLTDRTVLVSINGTLGNVAFYNNEKIVLGKSACYFNLLESVDKDFIKYILSSPYFLSYAHKEATGATIKNVSLKTMREFEIPLPPLPEQQRIVSILDQAFSVIERSRKIAEQNLKNAKALFESYLHWVFENGNWETKTIGEVCDEIFAGGDAPKNNLSLEENEKHQIPIYANAVKDRGLYGYTDFARVTKPSITISARGSGTGHTEIRNEAYLPIVRLIVLIPNTEIVNMEFLKYKIDTLDILRSGSAIPQLTVPMIKEYNIPIPPLTEQQTIVARLDALSAETKRLEAIYQQKLLNLEELKKSVLQKAFNGEL